MRHPKDTRLVVRLVAIAILGLAAAGEAATFTVNHVSDLPDVDPGNGVCGGLFGFCTLRAAVDEANALAGSDVIVIPAGTYAVGSELAFDEDVTVNGAGAAVTVVTTLEPAPDFVFRVKSNVYATLTDLTLRGSKTALFAFESILEVSRVWFDGNSGRAISVSDGNATIRDSTFTANSASGASGGGALGVVNDAVVTVTSSTFYGNSAALGGAILLTGEFSSLDLRSSTLVHNFAGDGSHALSFDGAGSLHMDKTLIVGACHIGDPMAVTSNGGNAESPGNTCLVGAFGDQPNLTPVQLHLGTLGNYGGPVPTILPGTESVLVDPAFDLIGICPSTDARGAPRIDTCDVGATERQPWDPESGPFFLDGFESGDTSRWSS